MNKSILCGLLFIPVFSWGQKVLELQSPDKATTLQINMDNELALSIEKNGTVVLQPSAIGMKVRGIGMLGDQPKVKSTSRRTVSGQSVQTPIYRKNTIEEAFNELTVQFKGDYAVCFRCYDQGVAYRFQTNLKGKDIYIDTERAAFRFPEATPDSRFVQKPTVLP